MFLALDLNSANLEVSVDLKASLVALFDLDFLFVGFHFLGLRHLLELRDKRLDVMIYDCALDERAESEQLPDLLTRA